MHLIIVSASSRSLFKTVDAGYRGIIYFSEAVCLGQDKMLKRFYDLQNEIQSLMNSIGKFVPELEDEKWLTELAFLVDLAIHLNELNVSQSENQLTCAVSNHNSIQNEI